MRAAATRLAWGLAALVGCSTPALDVGSEAEAYDAAEVCARGGPDAIEACTGAIRSGHLDSENQARAYMNRGVAYDHADDPCQHRRRARHQTDTETGHHHDDGKGEAHGRQLP